MKIQVPEHAKFIIGTLQAHGHEAYVVGGCVRDSLLGRTPKDWDITTSASPEQVKDLFSHTIDTGLQHGTVTVLLGRQAYEVTTYRVDGAYEDHRRPSQVLFTKSLAEDVLRRDFTINAMAYNDEEGLIDLHGGADDLKNGVIRCVGVAADRFDEDALRILRALRFAARFDFSIEEETKKAMVEKKEFLRDISAERIREEFTGMITSDHPEIILTAYEMGITKIILPEWDVMMETPQNNPHHIYNVGIHSLEGMKKVPATPVFRYTMLLHDVGKPGCRTTDEKGIDHFKKHPLLGADMARTIMRRLKFDNDTTKKVVTLVEWHDWRYTRLEKISKNGIRRLAGKIGMEAFRDLLIVQRADSLAQSLFERDLKLAILERTGEILDEIQADGDCLTLKELKIGGKDLISMGMPPGKEIGSVLNKLLDWVLDHPEDNQREILMKMAEELR